MGNLIRKQNIFSITDALEPELIEHRRTIHRFAELGGQEVKTQAYLIAQTEKLGLPYERVGDTGLLVVLDTGLWGPHIALRADIDALPLAENPNNLKTARSCISEQPETCHACGHDAHAAMLLGAMKALSAHKAALCGTVYFCFEAGEENGKGAAPMLEALSQRTVDAVWAIHVYAALPSGKIGIRSGACMAGYGVIDITVHGQGGHGSRPDHAKNPVYAAASIVTNVPGAFVNQLDVEKTVTYGVTSIQGGTAGNVIPETAHIAGSMRFFDLKEGEKAMMLLKNTAEHIAAVQGCTVSFGKGMERVLQPVINDQACAALAREAIGALYGEDVLSEYPLWYASESFSRYCARYPGVLMMLGIQNEAYGSGAEHHNERFDVDEAVLKRGTATTLCYTLALMERFSADSSPFIFRRK